MKTKLIRIAKVIVFCILFLCILTFVASLFKPKWLENRWQSAKTNNSFYELEKDSIDVAVIGSSVAAASVDPFQLYSDYGISAYNMGVMQQNMMGSYYWLKELLNTQKPKVVILEIKAAARMGQKEESDLRKSYDYMRWGLNKVKYALTYHETYPEETNLMDYLFPLNVYHSRWSEILEDDYDFVLGNNKSVTRGFATLSGISNTEFDGIEIKSDETNPYDEVGRRFLRGFIEKCQENNVELILMKTADTSWNYKKHNYIQKIADEYSATFIDFNEKSLYNEVGFEYAKDAADSVHLNILGAKKTTAYLGQYMKERFELTDYRTKEGGIHDTIEEELKAYNLAYADAMVAMETDLDTYLQSINNEKYAVAIANGCSFKGTFTDNQRQLFMELGMSEKSLNGLVNGIDVISVMDNNKEIVSNVSDEGTGITEEGYIDGKTLYSIKASSYDCKMKFATKDEVLNAKKVNIVVFDKELVQVADSAYLTINKDGTVTLER